MSADDNSSDYGSDFTPDEEALVDELLASVATRDTGFHTDRATTTAVTGSIDIGDIEDCHYAPVLGTLGRNHPDATVSGAVGLSAQETGIASTTPG